LKPTKKKLTSGVTLVTQQGRHRDCLIDVLTQQREKRKKFGDPHKGKKKQKKKIGRHIKIRGLLRLETLQISQNKKHKTNPSGPNAGKS